MACPICARDPDPKYRPFCSKRCADIDLGKWLTGAYAVPVEEADEWGEDSAAPDDDRPGSKH